MLERATCERMKYKTDIFHRILQGKNMIFVWQVSNSLNENSSVIWQDRVLSKDLPIKPKVRKTRFSSKSLALAKFSLNFRYKFKISFHKPFDVEKQIKSVKSESLKVWKFETQQNYVLWL